MLLWWMFVVSVVFAEEKIRLAVLEFRSIGNIESALLLQLSDETRGGALDVFPASTSNILVLTRENISDVLAKEGKDISCMESTCAVTVGKNIGARFVVVGTLTMVDSYYSLTLAVYDTASNDLLGQKSIQEKSQISLLDKTRSVSTGLIEQTLGQYDQGRLGVKKIGIPDNWTVPPTADTILELSGKVLQGSSIQVQQKQVCSMATKSVCHALVTQGTVDVQITRPNCDMWKQSVSVPGFTSVAVDMSCHFVLWDGPTHVDSALIYIDGQPIQANAEILVGNHEVSIENGCAESRQNIVVRKGQKIEIQPNWIPKTRDIDIHYLGSNNEEQVGNVLVDGVSRGTTPLKLSIPVCSSVQVQDGKDILAVSLEKAVNNRIDVSKFTYVQGNGYKALLIPAGSFTMGCTSEQGRHCYDWEKPSHTVKISKAFYLMDSEVTQALYEKVMGSNPSKYKGSKRPVEEVSWYDAVTFANKLSDLEGRQQCYQISGESVSWTKDCTGWRLPTEAEWEYASRGGQSYKYAGSNTVGDVAWYTDNSRGETHDVCGKQKNGYGLCDMSGNVYEWVWDFWGSYSSRTQVDPQGPTSGSARVNRGGSWFNNPGLVRVSYRSYYAPTRRDNIIGFRLGLSP